MNKLYDPDLKDALQKQQYPPKDLKILLDWARNSQSNLQSFQSRNFSHPSSLSALSLEEHGSGSVSGSSNGATDLLAHSIYKLTTLLNRFEAETHVRTIRRYRGSRGRGPRKKNCYRTPGTSEDACTSDCMDDSSEEEWRPRQIYKHKESDQVGGVESTTPENEE